MEEISTGLLECAQALRTGELTPLEYCTQLKHKFATIEQDIKAFVPEQNRWDRLERAVLLLESRFPYPDRRPPLYGVPVGIKDIFSVDGFDRQAGSAIPADALAGPEAQTVTRIKDAGGLILGRTVTTEFAHADPGPTRNPHNTEHTPGGSSSGSAASVAAGLCPLAVGSQTIGSVARPAAFCGVVGVKPSYDRISADGVFPVAPSVDTPGYFTQDVAGAQLAAGVLYTDWKANDEPSTGCTIGAVCGPYLEQASEVAQDYFESHLETLADAGYEVDCIQLFDDIEEINTRHQQLVAAEMTLSHNELYPEYGDQYAQATAELIENGRTVSVESLASARAGRKALREQIHERMEQNAIDIIVSPSAPGPAPEGLASTGDPSMNLPWSHAGLPTVTIPASRTDDGLPIGLQCAGHYGRDEWLLSWCEEIQAVL